MRKTRRKQLLVLAAIIAVLGIIAASYILLNLYKFTIAPDCGTMFGHVYNRVDTQEDCKVQCRNECIAKDKKLFRATFLRDESTGCHSCQCFCI